MKALVVNCQRNGLGVIRSLAAHKVGIIAVDHSSRAPGLFSRHVSRRGVVIRPQEDEQAFVSQIRALAEAEQASDKIILIPTNDEYVLSFARYWDRLADLFCPAFETNLDVLLNCVDKTRMYKVAEAAGVPFPQTFYGPLASEAIAELPYPVVIKPFNRRAPSNRGKEVFRIRHCHTPAELESAAGLLERQDVRYVVQEFIPGGDDQLYTAGIYAHRGKLIGVFTGRKIRQFPPVTGECSYGEIIDAPRVAALADQFVRTAGYTGIAQVEFKQYSGEFYLMEINPRSWSWNSLSTYAGVNLPWIACNAALGIAQAPVYPRRSHGTWSYASEDLLQNVIQNHNVSPWQAARQIITADCHAHWQMTDPLPAIIYGLSFIVRRLRGSRP